MQADIAILAIESSCDETAASVIVNGRIISNIVYSQEIHQQYGGVIPEAASRLHIKHIVAVVDEALKQSGISKTTLSAVAYTQSPGLIGALMVGACFAKGFAQALSIPTIAVNHMQAHVLANLIEHPQLSFPFLCLTVSGGHTQIVRCDSPLSQQIIGETIDDAAGEAFDKAAKMLGLPYPGGPLIDTYAKGGNEDAFEFAKPQIPGLNFSFSGLKTSILYFLQKQLRENPNFITDHRADLCASIQKSIVSILIKKIETASKLTGIRRVALAGGVSANSLLRSAMQRSAEKRNWELYIPSFAYCTDNAAMIAITAHYKYMDGQFANLDTVPSARG